MRGSRGRRREEDRLVFTPRTGLGTEARKGRGGGREGEENAFRRSLDDRERKKKRNLKKEVSRKGRKGIRKEKGTRRDFSLDVLSLLIFLAP